MECKHCKAKMKDVCKTTGWIQKSFLWCPECGTYVKLEHGIITVDDTWYYPESVIIGEVV